MLTLSLDIGDTLLLVEDGRETRITLTSRTGRRANLRIDAAEEVKVSRVRTRPEPGTEPRPVPLRDRVGKR